MSLVSCSLQFENSLAFYRPGEVIKGSVIFSVAGSCPILIKGLSIQFEGFASCKWEKSQEGKKSHKPTSKEFYVNREDYISTQNFLIGSEEANPSDLQPGIHNYSFMVHIPVNAPSSFEAPLGSIRYDLRVLAHYNDHSECLTSCMVNVVQLKDLRRLAALEQQTLTERDAVEHKSCLKFWRKPLQLYISVQQVAYAVDECISLHIKVSNYENLRLKDITSQMNRIVSYQGFIKEKNPKTTTEITSIACHVQSLFGQNSSVLQHLQQIYVPHTPNTMDFSECKCLSVSYELEVTVCADKQKRTIKAVMPIVVGSISLTSDVKIIEANDTNGISNHVSSITVARSMDDLNLPSCLDMEEPNQLAAQQMQQTSVSMMSLTSSFMEADYMSPVKLNKKSKGQLSDDAIDFKPKYLYYDLPAESQMNHNYDQPPSSIQ